jgi:geranylgeranyl reductase family protein
VRDSFDVVVAGSGPAGAVAALVLARGGARVLLADPAHFPRDKACGDVVGPRGVALLEALGVLPAGEPAGDIVLVGPTWSTVRLPWPAGTTYRAGALVVQRARLDAALHGAALSAGAQPHAARVQEVGRVPGGLAVGLSDGSRVRASFVIGADGALSRVAGAAGLLRPERALWGFALRGYVAQEADAPYILLWAPRGRRPLPGYGWLFPAGPGVANVGLGVALRADRARATLAGQLLPAFIAALQRRGLLAPDARLESRRGGWLRMGLSGALPAADRVLLAGDAAGLVNPMQGEGISEATTSGRAAAEAILERPGQAAAAYRSALARTVGPFQCTAAVLHDVTVARPRLRTLAARTLTAPAPARWTAAGFAIWWNDLLDGAQRGTGHVSATAFAASARLATSSSPRRGDLAHWGTAAPPAAAPTPRRSIVVAPGTRG